MDAIHVETYRRLTNHTNTEHARGNEAVSLTGSMTWKVSIV